MGNVKIKLEQLIKLKGFSQFPKESISENFHISAVNSLSIELRLKLVRKTVIVTKI